MYSVSLSNKSISLIATSVFSHVYLQIINPVYSDTIHEYILHFNLHFITTDRQYFTYILELVVIGV